jgi:hypothetical protein
MMSRVCVENKSQMLLYPYLAFVSSDFWNEFSKLWHPKAEFRKTYRLTTYCYEISSLCRK